MSEPFNPDILQPGDAILYFSHDFGSWLIALKTWTKVAHVEIYRGNRISYSSRLESGVNAYLRYPVPVWLAVEPNTGGGLLLHHQQNVEIHLTKRPDDAFILCPRVNERHGFRHIKVHVETGPPVSPHPGG